MAALVINQAQSIESGLAKT